MMRLLRAVGRAVEELTGELVPRQPSVADELAQSVLGAYVEQAHPAGLEHVRKRPLQQLASTPQPPAAPRTANSAPVPIHRDPSRRLFLPAAAPSVQLRDVAA